MASLIDKSWLVKEFINKFLEIKSLRIEKSINLSLFIKVAIVTICMEDVQRILVVCSLVRLLREELRLMVYSYTFQDRISAAHKFSF